MCYRRVGLLWLVNFAKVGRKWIPLCYCPVGDGFKRPTLSRLDVLIVNDIILETKGGKTVCSDARWCMNLKCPYNRACPEELGVKSRAQLEKLHAMLEECLTELKRMHPELLDREKLLKRERGFVIVRERKRGTTGACERLG